MEKQMENQYSDENKDIIDELEEAGLLTEEYDDYDETITYIPKRKNKKKRKRREHRLWVRMLKKTIALTIIIGTVLSISIFGFQLQTVDIIGNYAYTDDDILKLLNYYNMPKNTLLFCWHNREDIVDGVPFIESINVSFGGPSTALVNVSEKMIIGCIDDHGVYLFFDNTGTVVESSTNKPKDIPLILGLNLSDIHIGEKINLDDITLFNNLYELSILLRKYELTIEEIEYTSNYSLVLKKENIQILIGTGKNLEDKINAIKDLLPSINGMTGVLHLENYDSSKESVFFSKDEK